MMRLGGSVTGFSDAKMTRAGDFYQESIKDTVKMLEFYGDVIVMRHFQQGAPHEAAKWASIPIINGGDGWGEHPTQILTDFYTVMREKGRMDGLKWLAVGDMRMRTMHSLAYGLTQFDCPITFVSPPDMSSDRRIQGRHCQLWPQLPRGGTRRRGHRRRRRDPRRAGGAARLHQIPRRRSGEVGWTPSNYKITRELLTTKAKSDAILLHSLPRMDENPGRRGHHPLVALLARSVQRRRHAHGVAGAGYGRDGVRQRRNHRLHRFHTLRILICKIGVICGFPFFGETPCRLT
jgi:aspartate carbamoyltransferase catalytic subunit